MLWLNNSALFLQYPTGKHFRCTEGCIINGWWEKKKRMFVHNPRAKPINSPDNGGGDEKKDTKTEVTKTNCLIN
jgi:hypothetical protein